MHRNPSSLRDLFDALIDLAPEARETFLAGREVDAEQRARLQRMLASRSHPASGTPDIAPEELARTFADEDAADVLRPGSRIGTFDLIDVVGEGGSSTVFRA